jgi:hypothetical protein
MCGIALDSAQCVSAVVAESRDPGSQPFASGSDWFRYSSPLAAGIAPCQIRVIMWNSPRVDKSPINSNKLSTSNTGKAATGYCLPLVNQLRGLTARYPGRFAPNTSATTRPISSVAGLRSGIAAFMGRSHFALEDF